MNPTMRLTAEKLFAWSAHPATAELPSIPEEEMRADHERWMHALQSGTPIYGVSTGFGPLVSHAVAISEAEQLQENLIQQLSAHSGPVLPWQHAKAVTFLRMFTLLKARSGVRPEVARVLQQLGRSGVAPAIPRWGSVGASGDLVPLAALAGTVNGYHTQGIDQDGRFVPLTGFEPLKLKPKEGLALVNGTAFSAAITAVESVKLNQLMQERIVPATLAVMFLLDESFQHLSDAPYAFKPHEGVTSLLALKNRWISGFSPDDSTGVPQPPYSSRTWMLWMGTAMERLLHGKSLLETELNGIDDNPLHIDGRFYHAGHFQGTFVTYAADEFLQTAMLSAQLLERQLNRLLHPAHNNGMPAFLAPEPVGLNSGLQGLQLLATSLLGEIRQRAIEHTTLSHPTNNDNQDLVSMSAHAANDLMEVVARLDVISAALSAAVVRARQLKPEVFMPEPLLAWLQNFENVQSADFRSIRMRTLLSEMQLFSSEQPFL